MRNASALVVLSLSLFATTGCEELVEIFEDIESIGDEIEGLKPDPDKEARRRIVFENTRGAAFGSRDKLWTGMGSVTCSFGTRQGEMRRDTDLGTGRERVIDADPDQAAVMIAAPDRAPSFFDKPFEVKIVSEDTVAGHFTDEGLIRLVDSPTSGCTLEFELEQHTTVNLNDSACAWPSIAVDRETSTVWVADNGTVEVVTPDSSDVVAEADLVAYDMAISMLYTADGTELNGLSLNGETLWTLQTDRYIDAIAALPANSTLVAHTRSQLGKGTLIVVNGLNGAFLYEEPVHEAFAAQLLADTETSTVAINTGDNTVVYNLPEDI